LPPPIVNALWWAGRIHDVGKVDRRFQLWLRNGDEVSAAISDVVLAKSTTPKQDTVARRLARERAGYPRGQRHELVSLDMAEGSAALRQRIEADGVDWDLVLHLVASHHGWCRPVAPPVRIPERDVEDVSWDVEGVPLSGKTGHHRGCMDSGVVERFWCLVRRYGWHELAYLEAVLRLADHRRSAEEQEG
jgi:CRISPR-associated endonuclease/helicase Cas3